jgi:beta-glucosidase
MKIEEYWKSKVIKSFILIILFSIILFGQEGSGEPVYRNPEESIDKRIEDLLGRMTLEEKVGQMCQYSGFSDNYEELLKNGRIGSFLNIFGAEQVNKVQRIAVEQTRFGIPVIFGIDVIHGYSTIFPIPLAIASSWDPDIARMAASIAAEEAASDGIHWTFAPMVDIARDPRWGRIAEGSGEDTYLGSMMAKVKVEGFQGKSLGTPNTIVACPKHYVAYGGALGGRDYNTVDISERTLREVYLPPFKAAIVDAGAGTIMSAFNELSGIPTSANYFTLHDILREEWGFEGFVVSDWNSIGELINHGIAGTPEEAAYKAITAGVDMDMMGNIYQVSLDQLVKDGEVSEKAIDDAVRNILRIKFRLGLFENPYIDPELASRIIMSKKNVDMALKVAQKCIVLLKNDNNILPLDKNVKRIAVIGPLADSKDAPLGPWSCIGDSSNVVTVLEGLKSRAPDDCEVLYAKGCQITEASYDGFEEAIKIAKKAEKVILVVGESRDMSGEAASRAYLDLPGIQRDLVEEIYNTGVQVILVLMNGRPLAISWSAENIPSILETWFSGVQAGNAIADIIFGNYNPSAKLPVTFPYTVGQVPIYYNHKNTGRPPSPLSKWNSKYIDAPFTPLYPFGYGLSYTQFEYSNLKIDKKKVKVGGEVTISVDIKNTGSYEGTEVAQLYVNDVVSNVTTPIKELKGFKSVKLKPGEEKTVKFTLNIEQLGIYDENMQYIVEPGVFEIMVGKSSSDIQLTDSIEVI